jgi:iron complex outermembrane receptor protein
MKKILIHLVLILHIGNGLIAQVSETTLRKATKNTLSGKVVDFKNNSPLEGATVYLNDLKIGVATASDGSFTLNNIPAGKHMA